MKAVVIDRFGGAEHLKLVELPPPAPAANEVLVEIAYTSVNPVDWKIREGYLKDLMPHAFPLIPGWDAAGVVGAVGEDATAFKPGDKVYAYCRKPLVQAGTYAEFIALDAAVVAPMPANLSFAEAATVPLTGLTAWQALFDFARLSAGQQVLIHAGAGGVGSLAIQFAKYAGATVYTTASQKNHDYVTALGADVAIDYTHTDFAAALKAIAPHGIDLVFDMLGGEILARSYDVVKPGGALVSIVDPPCAKTAAEHQIRAGFVFVSPNGEQLRKIASLIEAGAVKPARIEQELRLEDAAIAQEKSQARHVQGKIVLKIK